MPTLRVALQSVQLMLGKKCVPLHLAIGSQQSFRGMVDVLQQKAFVYESGGAGKFAE